MPNCHHDKHIAQGRMNTDTTTDLTDEETSMKPNQALRTLTATAVAAALVAPLLLASAPASAETRGYVISLFGTATTGDFTNDCRWPRRTFIGSSLARLT